MATRPLSLSLIQIPSLDPIDPKKEILPPLPSKTLKKIKESKEPPLHSPSIAKHFAEASKPSSKTGKKQKRSISSFSLKSKRDNITPRRESSFSDKFIARSHPTLPKEEKGKKDTKKEPLPKALVHYFKTLASSSSSKNSYDKELTFLFSKLKKHEDRAQEIKKWISNSEENIPIIVEALCQSQEKRLEDSIAHFSSYIELIPLISLYSKKKQDSIESLASKICEIHSASSMTMLATIRHFTRYEIQLEKEETIFRGSSLTVELSKLHLESLLQNALQAAQDILEKSLKKCDPKKICIDPKRIAEDTLKKNTARFVKFSDRFLTEFYKLQLPEKCYVLLNLRRTIVTKHFNSTCAESSVNELLFLRIFNPFLHRYGQSLSDDFSKSVITSLLKVLQNLANDVLFGDEKKNEILEQLNPLLKKFKEQHRLFLQQQMIYENPLSKSY